MIDPFNIDKLSLERATNKFATTAFIVHLLLGLSKRTDTLFPDTILLLSPLLLLIFEIDVQLINELVINC